MSSEPDTFPIRNDGVKINFRQSSPYNIHRNWSQIFPAGYHSSSGHRSPPLVRFGCCLVSCDILVPPEVEETLLSRQEFCCVRRQRQFPVPFNFYLVSQAASSRFEVTLMGFTPRPLCCVCPGGARRSLPACCHHPGFWGAQGGFPFCTYTNLNKFRARLLGMKTETL